MQKNYVLDTNVLIYDPDALFMFEDNNVFLSIVTLTELTDLKNREGEVAYEARCVRDRLRSIRDENRMNNENFDPADGYALGEGLGRLYIVDGMLDDEYEILRKAKTVLPKCANDVMIIGSALWVKSISSPYPDVETILLTDDADMYFLADAVGLHCDAYRNKTVDHTYTGRRIFEADDAYIDSFYRNGYALPMTGWDPVLHEFLLVRGYENPKHSFIGRYDGNRITPLEEQHPFGVTPRNNGQKFMISAMMDPEIPLVFVDGAAGTAKTFLSLACGLEQTLETKRYERILLTRAHVEMDATYGFLPGGEYDKVSPMLRAFSDNMEHLMRPKDPDGANEQKDECKDGEACPNVLEMLMSAGVIRMEAMEYMRGRSLDNTYLIIDEAQNMTPHQAYSIISRVGENSKIIMLGDPDQIDNRHLNRRNNGLVYSAERFIGSPMCAQIHMEESESTRSPLAAEAVKRLSPRGVRR